jgi:hypothetical protein
MAFNAVTGKTTGLDLYNTSYLQGIVTPAARPPLKDDPNLVASGTAAGTATPVFVSGAAQVPPAAVKQDLANQATNEASGKSVTMKTVRVTPVQTQPTAPPTIGLSAGSLNEIDAYRNGSARNGDLETLWPRTLGEREVDQPSYMTLSAVEDGEELIAAYSRFFLQSVSEVEQEKYQVVETFTGYYAFFYGKRPPIYRYSGILLSDQNFAWNNDFKFVYENYFRGTKATEYSAQVLMVCDNRVISGYPLSLSMQQDAMVEKGMPFSMDLLVVDHVPTSFSSDVSALLEAQKQALNERQAQILAAAKAGEKSASTESTLRAKNSINGVDPMSGLYPGSSSANDRLPVSGASVDNIMKA